ncbi:MAG: T9SS type A sorting domain-containing protein [Bacteroidia bacterium]
MKKIYSLIFFLFAAFSTKAQAPTPDLLHYKFDGSGSLVTNYASNPPAGTATGTIMGGQTQTGGINCMGALVGTGATSTSDYMNTGWAPNLGSGAWTLSFWTSNIIQTTSTYYILGDVNSGGFRVFTGGVAGSGNWILRGSMTDVYLNTAASTTPCMASFVYSPTFSNVVGYINGVPTTTVAQASMLVNGTGPFKVGGYSNSNSLNSGGLMADFRFYSTALTANDILNIYNFGISTLSLNVSATSSVCPGQSTQITASGANSYTWNTGAFTSSINVTPSVTTTYTVNGAAGNCTASATSTITVLSQPALTVNSGSVCTGSSFTINPSGASTYTIQGGSAVVTPSANSTYSVIGTGTNGCVSQAVTSTVSVNNLPTVSASSSASMICVGQSASLTATGASAYVWNTTATSAVIVISPTTTTSYTVTGTDANNCSNTFTLSQTVSSCTGIDKNSSELTLSAFPNPTTGEVIIMTHNNDLKGIELIDITGRTITQFETSNPTVELNMNTLSNGVYLLKCTANQKTSFIKIIKQ